MSSVRIQCPLHCQPYALIPDNLNTCFGISRSSRESTTRNNAKKYKRFDLMRYQTTAQTLCETWRNLEQTQSGCWKISLMKTVNWNSSINNIVPTHIILLSSDICIQVMPFLLLTVHSKKRQTQLWQPPELGLQCVFGVIVYLQQHYPVLPVCVWCHCLPVTALPSPASVCMVSLFTCDSTTQSCQCVYGVIVYLWQHYPVLPVCVWCHCLPVTALPSPVSVWCHCLPVTALPSPVSVCLVSLFTCDSATQSYQCVFGAIVYL